MEDLTRKLRRVYRQATEELEETLAEFEAKHSLRDAKMRQKLADGKITKQYYDRWKQGQVFQGKQWRAKLESAARTLEHADEEAAKIMNRQRIGTFTEAANDELKTASIITGADFNVYDQRTVDRMLREEPNLLPPRRVKKAEDVEWYHQLISNAVTRSIIEGDSIEGLAHKIALETGEKSWNAAKRNARTAMTAAQNAGRLESMHDVQARGIKVKKKWLAAHDSRVRDTHRELDGQEKGVDEPFEVGGMEIMYPGDPAAHPSLVYNCRCTLQYVYPEYENGKMPEAKAVIEPATAPKKPKRESTPAKQKKAAGSTKAKGKAQATPTGLQEKKGYTPERLDAEALSQRIEYREPQRHKKLLKEQEMIDRIAGGDLTEGSCASLAYCYVGQMSGIDVQDFRGGMSRYFIAHEDRSLLRSIAAETGKKLHAESGTGTEAAMKLLGRTEPLKRYFFVTGKHAAIVRKLRDGTLQYLELQSGKKNGWRTFGEDPSDLEWALCARFKHGSTDLGEALMMDVEDMRDSRLFKRMLGYINTEPGKQQKGAGGHEK